MRHLIRDLSCLALVTTSLLIAAPARADIVRPEESECRAKKADSACSAVKGGTCQPTQCCRMRYMPADPKNPAQPRMKQVCRECLMCQKAATKKIKKPAATPDMGANDEAQDALNAMLSADLGVDEDMSAPTDMPADMPDKDAAPELMVAAPDAAPDMSAPAAQAPQPEVVAEKTRGGMCAAAPWSGDAGTWSLALGAFLLVGLRSRRRSGS